MPTLSHDGLGLAAKRFAPKIQVVVLVSAGMLTGRIYRQMRIGAFNGILVFSHWLLDILMWPPSTALLYAGGPAIGFNLGNPICIGIAIEVGVLIIGIVVYIRSQAVRAH